MEHNANKADQQLFETSSVLIKPNAVLLKLFLVRGYFEKALIQETRFS